MSIVRIDPEGWRNAEHIAITVVVVLVPIQIHFCSRRPQAQQPLHPDGHWPQAQLKTSTGERDDGHRPSLVHPQRETRPHAVIRSLSTPWRLCVGFHSPDVEDGGGK